MVFVGATIDIRLVIITTIILIHLSISVIAIVSKISIHRKTNIMRSNIKTDKNSSIIDRRFTAVAIEQQLIDAYDSEYIGNIIVGTPPVVLIKLY
jgi:hypothetical protein